MSQAGSLPERINDVLRRIVGTERPGLLVAVSGGPDSCAVAHLVSSIGEYPVRLAYLNHRLRSEAEQRGERAAVEALAAILSVPLEAEDLGQGRIVESERARETGLEAAARSERYRYLTERALANDVILVTGHHRDDVIETTLMQMLSGRSLTGNRLGIAEDMSMKSPDGRRVRVIRPALELSRSELRSWCDDHGLPYVIDSTNTDRRFRRNDFRAGLLPVLREFYHGADAAVLRHAREVEDLKAAVEAMLPNLPEENRLDREDFSGLPAAARALVLRRLAQRVSSRDRLDTTPLEELIRTPHRFRTGWSKRFADLIVSVDETEIGVNRVVRTVETGYLWVIRGATMLESRCGVMRVGDIATKPVDREAVFFGPVQSPLVVRPIHPGDKVLRGGRVQSITDVIRDMKRGQKNPCPPSVLEDRGGIFGLVWCEEFLAIRDGCSLVPDERPGFSPPLYLECEDDSINAE